MSRLRTVIVDDEPPARAKLRHFLSGDERVELVGEAGDGLEAVGLIERVRPDLVLLDIQMPVPSTTACDSGCLVSGRPLSGNREELGNGCSGGSPGPW